MEKKTDVQVFSKISSSSTCTGGGGGACTPHADTYRPLVGGISAAEEFGTACTLGMIVYDSTDNKLVAITNNHCSGVLYDPTHLTPTDGVLDPAGIKMLQPSPLDGGSLLDEYGVVKRSVPIQFGTALGTNIVDVSISTVGVNDADSDILELDEGPFLFAGRDEYLVGEEVYKSGRTTGITPLPTTTVFSKSASANVAYGSDPINDVAPFFDQIICTATTRFTQGGDSGSMVAVFIDGAFKIIGILFAATEDGTLAVINPIEHIGTELNIESWNGNIIVPFSGDELITVNGTCYKKLGNVKNKITHTED